MRWVGWIWYDFCLKYKGVCDVIKVRVLNVRWVVFDKSNVSSLKGGFYWGFCVLGVGRCGNGVKMGVFRDGGEFEIW